MKPKEYYEAAVKFYKYTNGLDLGRFIDWQQSLYFDCVQFNIVAYLEYCEKLGMMDDESIEEFNLRYYKHGNRVNAIIKAMIK